MTDFEEASVAGFQHVYPDYPNASVAGCWFHYAQAIIKRTVRTNKIGLEEAYAYGSDEDVQNRTSFSVW